MFQSLPVPPGPRRALPGALLFEFRRDPIAFFMGLARDHGAIAHFRIGPQRVYFLNDPALIQEALVVRNRSFAKGGMLRRAKVWLGEGLLTSEGEHHLRQRRLMQPSFHRQRIAAYGATMVEQAAAFASRWEDGRPVDMATEMMGLSLAIVARTLFGADVEAETEMIERSVDEMLGMFGTLTLPLGHWLMRVPLPRHRRAQAAMARLDALIYRLIAERRRSATDRGDLLSMLLLAEDAEDAQRRMSAQQVRDEAFTLFVAGHETAANALTWALYVLSRHPELEAKVTGELDAVLGGRAPRFEDVPALVHTERFFAECLRLYSPSWAMGRLAVEETTLGEWTIPKGALVFMSQFVMHRDARFFPDPERFDPDRWLPEAKAERPKFSYFPFGGGARGCIGEGFAWMEGVLVLATLLQRWRFTPASAEAVSFEPLITLRPKGGLRLTPHRRV